MDLIIGQKETISEEDIAPGPQPPSSKSPEGVERFLGRDNDSKNKGLPARPRKGGGPRTQQGKQRSKLNALKHGIYSREVLLDGEPREEFDSLLRGLRKDFEPQGTHEELLVDRLAALYWRQRRPIIAERGEIRVGTEFLELRERTRTEIEGSQISKLEAMQYGLIAKISNPKMLEMCLELLDYLRVSINKDGLKEQRDQAVLARIYGSEEAAEATLYEIYRIVLDTNRPNASVDSEFRELQSPENFKALILGMIDREIARLKQYKREQAQARSNSKQIQSLRANVPNTEHLDRLTKSETNLDRAIDRILNRLERAQRKRQGMVVTPTLNVNLTP